jgi:CheY-like chemotaxis protein
MMTSTSADLGSTILLADDEKQWLFLTRRELANTGIKNLIEEAKDGEGVIEMLSRRLRQSPEALPLFVLLDLTMPRSNGLQALRWIRSQRGLDNLPVVMLTSSTLQRDVDEAFAAGADGYLQKGKNILAFTFIYEKARLVRQGKLTRATAFKGMPDSLRPTSETRERASADEEEVVSPA